MGVGLDVCDISRMEKLVRDGRFLARFFSEAEQEYIRGKGKAAAASMAGLFAAKEAFTKALGVGISADIRGISVMHDAYGAPYYALHGEYADLAEDKRIDSFFLSITHDAGVAAAVCVAERNG
ncbi:MAG: holo-ACP synthase [Clostridia bacterium]|nr:holo-ACP synthase [Clostridia bacterium]